MEKKPIFFQLYLEKFVICFIIFCSSSPKALAKRRIFYETNQTLIWVDIY